MLEELAEKMLENNVKPELEVFDVGMIHNALRVAKKGLIKPPFFFQFVLGAQGGIPASPENLMFMIKFQFGYMYGRYFMWNFAGRQNDKTQRT